MIVLKISFKIPKNAIKGVILTTFFNVAYSVAFYIGIMLGNAGSAGVITTTLAPIFSSLIGAFIYNVTLNQAEKLGLFLGFIGGVFLLGGFSAMLNPYYVTFLGAALLWGFVTLSSRLATPYVDSIVLNFYSSLISGCVFFPVFFIDGFLDVAVLDSRFWLCMIGISVFATTFGTTIFYKGVAILGFSRGGSFTLLVPLFALVFSYVLLDEISRWNTIIGGSIAVFAIYLINFHRHLFKPHS